MTKPITVLIFEFKNKLDDKFNSMLGYLDRDIIVHMSRISGVIETETDTFKFILASRYKSQLCGIKIDNIVFDEFENRETKYMIELEAYSRLIVI